MIIFMLPFFKWLPQVKVLDKCIAEVRKEFELARATRMAEHARGENLELDDCLNTLIVENTSGRMNDSDMFDHFMTLIAAGHDTSAYFSSYLVYLLAKHPDVQERLRKEVLGYFKGRTEVNADDILHLTYLTQVMQETLRVYAVISCVSRKCTVETHIKEANITIPQGVEIMIPMTLINRCDTAYT
jgi:cytochrome P450